jgi:ABC-type spermidine/putrescine transport system permease subunit I
MKDRVQSDQSFGKRALEVSPLAVWVLVLVVGPGLVLVLYSVWKNELVSVSHSFTLENYRQLISSAVVRAVLVRTFVIAVSAAGAATLIGYPLAYIVVRYFPRIKFMLALLIVVPLWVSYLMRIFAWKIILGQNGILNGALVSSGILSRPSRAFLYSPVTVIIALTYVGIPYVFLASYTILERIPLSLYEASGDCGASNWRTFKEVVWPISRPAAALGFALVFIITLGDYVTPTLVGGFNGTMVGVVILQAFGGLNNWPSGAALALITLFIALLVLALISPLMRSRFVLED